jgi:hypothetical protein
MTGRLHLPRKYLLLILAMALACQAVNENADPLEPRPLQVTETRLEVNKTRLSIQDPLEIEGFGFRPGEKVTLLFVQGDETQVLVGGSTEGQATADATGGFQTDFDNFLGSNPPRVSGRGAILAQGTDGNVASVPIEIVP